MQAYSARTQLDALFDGSFYRDSLITSRNAAAALRKILDDISALGDFSQKVPEPTLWQLENARSNFRTIFIAELATIPTYYVLDKPPYNTNFLLERGELTMPPALAEKVPDAVFDFREAGKCMAFDVGTACAFHSFRGLESVLRRYLQVVCSGQSAPKQRNLGVYIRALETGGGDNKIISALRQLKDLHRNPSVHPEAAISSDEAISIVGLVRSAVSVMLDQLPPAPPTTTTAV